MEIVERDGQPALTVGGAFFIPFDKESLLGTIDQAKALGIDQQLLVVRDAGERDVPEGTDPVQLGYAALSVVQNAWYTVVRGQVPEAVLRGHQFRMEKLREAAKVATVRLAEEMAKPKPPKVERPKREPKVPRAYMRTDQLPSGLVKGQAGVVADALRQAKELMTVPQLAVQVKDQLETRQPAERVVAYYLKQFVEKGYVK